MLQADANFRKSANALLKDSWFSGQVQPLDVTPPKIPKRINIMGTIEKYKKIYGSNRRNIIRESHNSSETKQKRTISTSPYNPSGAQYTQVFESAQNNNNLFIKTYFKNMEIKQSEQPQKVKNNALQCSQPIEQLYEEKVKRDHFKRNSKSNIQLRRDKKVEVISDSNKSLADRGQYDKQSSEVSMDHEKVTNFIHALSSKEPETLSATKRKTFTGTFRQTQHSPINPSQNQWMCFKRKNTKDEAEPFNAKTFDSGIIDMMQKLGYDVKDVYSGLIMGNYHMINVYQKLLKEKQDAINFMKAYHK